MKNNMKKVYGITSFNKMKSPLAYTQWFDSKNEARKFIRKGGELVMTTDKKLLMSYKK